MTHHMIPNSKYLNNLFRAYIYFDKVLKQRDIAACKCTQTAHSNLSKAGGGGGGGYPGSYF